MTSTLKVRAWTEDAIIPTYLPHAPDKHPMFLEKRVYQGSSGKVYPLPFTDRISETSTDHNWKAVYLENEYLKVMLLPEIGGRVHAIEDKSTGYDIIYRQHVIKPALVGLAGPWISGGIEFNWPQHHRPATFLPVDYEIEEHSDGSVTVWCSDHDPMTRMKGMHGVCLHPGKAYVEVKARAYNRTPFVQSFLWWANIATRVHEGYQSFFPSDVHHVADHARRATSEYPLCKGTYYGVHYGERGTTGVPADECPSQHRPPACAGADDLNYTADDLSWYANIPVPTSYMCLGSKEDYLGGYDYFQQVGIVHIANHHISPGKKQWTWGNHEFGYAWDRNLTDSDGPYIELMAGVYTDNQPDFSFLQPGETKSWSQFFCPIHKIGPPSHVDLIGAISLRTTPCNNGTSDCQDVFVGISVMAEYLGSVVRLERDGVLEEWTADITPGHPFIGRYIYNSGGTELLEGLIVRVLASDGTEVTSYRSPRASTSPTGVDVPLPANEPGIPEDLCSSEELYLTGLHLMQYRHATRSPIRYWQEALRRDPLDARCNNAMGLWRLQRGEYLEAENHFRNSIKRLTSLNPNPEDGEPFYNLGLCLRYHLDALLDHAEQYKQLFDDSYAAFYKATWNQGWAACAYHALAEMDSRRGDWSAALNHLDRALRLNTDNFRARNLKARVLRETGRAAEADVLVRETLAIDPMDWWARILNDERVVCDPRTAIDVANDFAVAGFYMDAIDLLSKLRAQVPPQNLHDLPTQSWGAMPIVHYTLGRLHDRLGDTERALAEYAQAESLPPDYCFPQSLEDINILKAAISARSTDARAPHYLGNLLYDRRRHEEAIRLWEISTKLENSSKTWRNLGIGYFNIARNASGAVKAYSRARDADPHDARLLYECDQLWKRTGESPKVRLDELERNLNLVTQRDDLSVELCALYNQTGQPEKALRILTSRCFQPWEGGEGQALGQYIRSYLLIGRRALQYRDSKAAISLFENALSPPVNLGEGRHLLANMSQVYYWIAQAYEQAGNYEQSKRHWQRAADVRGDFQAMTVRLFSEMTYFSAKSMIRLGERDLARRLLTDLLDYAQELQVSTAKIDYFATSLPTMLLFDDDIQFRQETTALLLRAQAYEGLGESTAARSTLALVIERDPNHAMAADMIAEIEQCAE
jgi:tetratricopeptide (TPR) repeat protein